jgi:hypothetical protein
MFNRKLRRSYLAVFDPRGEHSGRVMADLAGFCHYGRTTNVFDDRGTLDPVASAQIEGRRQVFLYIKSWGHFTEEELEALEARMGSEDD